MTAAAAQDQGVSARWWLARGKLAVGAGADWSPTPAEPNGVASLRRQQRFALEFRARSFARESSVLRMQLSSDAALHFRPRSRGLQVSYRERF